jgi:DNA-directed RNA polymerase subunit RPC12/RpoP
MGCFSNSMSEFKFICPACGQHIKCEAWRSNSMMECPMCFQRIIVPHASATDDMELIIKGSKATKRLVTKPEMNLGRPPAPSRPAKNFPVAGIAFVILLCAAIAAGFVFKGKIFKSAPTETIPTATSAPTETTSTATSAPAEAAPEATAEQITLRAVKVDSAETVAQNGKGVNAVDRDPMTFWHTQWQNGAPPCPHEIIIELTPPSSIKGFTYLPRQDGSPNGTIKDYEFYVSDDGKDFGQPVNSGSFQPGKEKKIVTFSPKNCRFIKLRALSEINNNPWTSAAEIGVILNDVSTAKTTGG